MYPVCQFLHKFEKNGFALSWDSSIFFCCHCFKYFDMPFLYSFYGNIENTQQTWGLALLKFGRNVLHRVFLSFCSVISSRKIAIVNLERKIHEAVIFEVIHQFSKTVIESERNGNGELNGMGPISIWRLLYTGHTYIVNCREFFKVDLTTSQTLPKFVLCFPDFVLVMSVTKTVWSVVGFFFFGAKLQWKEKPVMKLEQK